MPETTSRPASTDIEAGQAVYSPLVLRLYDAWVLGVSNSLLWRCPTKHLVALYDRHVSAAHMDVGVGTGYYLDKCRFPTSTPEIVLVDLNEDSLATTAKRIERYHPTVERANALEPLASGGPRVGSIALNYLLHCVPGSLGEKADAAFAAVTPRLAEGGVVFGSTILDTGASHTRLSRRLQGVYNAKGIFHNEGDSLEDLERSLDATFASYELTTRGAVAIFSATEPRGDGRATGRS